MGLSALSALLPLHQVALVTQAHPSLELLYQGFSIGFSRGQFT